MAIVWKTFKFTMLGKICQRLLSILIIFTLLSVGSCHLLVDPSTAIEKFIGENLTIWVRSNSSLSADHILIDFTPTPDCPDISKYEEIYNSKARNINNGSTQRSSRFYVTKRSSTDFDIHIIQVEQRDGGCYYFQEKSEMDGDTQERNVVVRNLTILLDDTTQHYQLTAAPPINHTARNVIVILLIGIICAGIVVIIVHIVRKRLRERKGDINTSQNQQLTSTTAVPV